MQVKRLIFLVALLVLSWSVPVFADEAGVGVINGQIINGTVDGSSVAGQDITLRIYQGESELDAANTETDIEGRFVFSGLSTEPDYSYSIVAKYQGAEYYSEWLTFNEEETNISTEVVVYDATTSNEAIMVAMSHSIIYIEEDSLLIKEYYLFINDNDRTYIGSGGESGSGVLHFYLPEGATGIQYTMGLMECCIITNKEGFSETMPLLPGSREVAYSYAINQSSSKYTHVQTINYPTNRLDFLIEGEDIEITSDQLVNDEPLNISDINFAHLSAEGLTPKDNVEVRISGLPWKNGLGGYWLIFLVLALICAIFIPLYLKKKRKPQSVSIIKDPSALKQQLLTELANLDNDFEEGKIPEKTYRKLRTEKKAELTMLMLEQKEE